MKNKENNFSLELFTLFGNNLNEFMIKIFG
jgi:hypothetical protein